MKALRHEVRQLEHEYARTIQLKQQQQWREVTEALGSDAEREGSDALVEKYMQLSIKKQQLHRENQALGAVLAQHAKFHLKAQHVLDAEDSQTLAVVPPPSTVRVWRPVWDLLV
jgi:flagellar biosynthesis/type III secretory pathway chaperone